MESERISLNEGNGAIPGLIETQLNSYRWFMEEGLKEVFARYSPIEDFGGKTFLEFGKHHFGPPKHDIRECEETEATYEVPLYVQVRLVDRTTGELKEAEVYLGDIPYMTDKGTFLINGAERVVVSQLARSPGIYFKSLLDVSGRELYSAQVIPDHGNWVEFEKDAEDVVWCKIGQGRRFPSTILLKALSHFEDLVGSDEKWERNADILAHFATPLSITETSPEFLAGKRVKNRLVHPETGEIILEEFGRIDKQVAKAISDFEIENLVILDIPAPVEATLQADPTEDSGQALLELFRRIKLSEAPNRETAIKIIRAYFFDNRRYNLGRVGRYKLSKKLGLDLPLEVGLLTKEDIAAILHYFCELDQGRGEIDEVDHLANKRVRAVGELLLEQFRIGMSRVEKIARERMSTLDPEKMVPSSVINFKPLQAAVRSFFGSSQLSQFMDEVNPLAELTHKRRLSALGPGGLSRRSAKLEVRDVHHSHYGRICPIETPEGQNVGLIGSLSVYAKIDEYGFIQTPYYKVVDGKVTDEIHYLNADDESKFYIAPADTPRDENGSILGERVVVRHKDSFPQISPKQVDYIDVTAGQVFSVATAMIPFLENNDPTRGLMGANMQRQAVPLLRPKAPAIQTGMEEVAARDSGAVAVCRRPGRVKQVDSRLIVVDVSMSCLEGKIAAQSIKSRDTDEVLVSAGQIIDKKTARKILLSGVDFVKTETEDLELPVLDEYRLSKFRRSNQSTCISQRPVVKEGQVVQAGDVLAEGASTDQGMLALGQDILVAYVPWHGYNYEDAVLISERLVKEDILTSIHVEKYETQARETKVGLEEITRDIPTLGEDALKNLDEDGIVFVGAEVGSDDILVGKIAPKGPSELSAEEKLIVAIFSKKAEDMRDVSLRTPYGERGTVIDRKIFSRYIKQCPTCEFTHDDTGRVERLTCPRCGSKMEQIVNENLPLGVNKLVRVFVAQKRKVMVGDKLAGRHGNKGVISKILPEEDMPFLPDGTPVDIVLNPLSVPSRMNVGQILEAHLGLVARELGVNFTTPVFEGLEEEQLYQLLEDVAKRSQAREIYKLAMEELELPLEAQVDPRDKNIVSENSPEVLLERIGQLLEEKSEEEIKSLSEELAVPLEALEKARSKKAKISALIERIGEIGQSRSGIDERTGRCTLYDGRTGEPFNLPAVVGNVHILKLAHLVEDKIHARSTGPYSLVTQQPLGGKAQMGGQRFGEMEVWALEAYGAAHTLQEILTVKSDDVEGRMKTYEAMVKGENITGPGVPESFVVLVKELQSLGLDVTVGSDDGTPIEFRESDETTRQLP